MNNRRDLAGRFASTPAMVRFYEKVALLPNGCWKWTSAIDNGGYGRFWVDADRPNKLAHRVAYELCRGPIPAGLFLDHLCRNRLCVNPEHLEPVTTRENNRRALPTHCKRGHPLSGDNLYRLRTRPNQRRCKLCAQQRDRRYRAEARAGESIERKEAEA